MWAPSTLPNLQKIRKDCCWYCLLGSSSTRAEGFDLESRLIYLIYRYSIGLSTTGRFLSQISLSGRNSIVWWRNNPRGERIDLTLLAIVWLIYFIFLFCFVLFCFVLFCFLFVFLCFLFFSLELNTIIQQQLDEFEPDGDGIALQRLFGVSGWVLRGGGGRDGAARVTDAAAGSDCCCGRDGTVVFAEQFSSVWREPVRRRKRCA